MMKKTCCYKKEYEVYPGEFSPPPEWYRRINTLRSRKNYRLTRTKFGMTENDDVFIVQVVIPAVRREQILLYVHESILTIVVLQKDFEPFPKSKTGQFKTAAGNTERHILLPPGADTEFVSAEYKRGILQIFVPKSINPSRVQERQIVVY